MPLPGPTANLPARARRSGKSATVWENAEMLGEVIDLAWNVNVAQIPVVIAGAWRRESKPGMEERAATFRIQDVHDKWALRVWRYIRARRDGDRSAASMPEFSLITKLDDVGAPFVTQWQLDGCVLFQYSGGGNVDDDLIIRSIPFSFRDERPLNAGEYTDSGVSIVQG